MKEHFSAVLWRLTRLLRARVIICMVGLAVMSYHPDSAQWIVAICGLAIGSSLVGDIRKEDKDGR